MEIGMAEIAPWLTPALLIGLFAWLRADISALRRELQGVSGRVDALAERLARLEGRIGGWQDRDHGRPAAVTE